MVSPAHFMQHLRQRLLEPILPVPLAGHSAFLLPCYSSPLRQVVCEVHQRWHRWLAERHMLCSSPCPAGLGEIRVTYRWQGLEGNSLSRQGKGYLSTVFWSSSYLTVITVENTKWQSSWRIQPRGLLGITTDHICSERGVCYCISVLTCVLGSLGWCFTKLHFWS